MRAPCRSASRVFPRITPLLLLSCRQKAFCITGDLGGLSGHDSGCRSTCDATPRHHDTPVPAPMSLPVKESRLRKDKGGLRLAIAREDDLCRNTLNTTRAVIPCIFVAQVAAQDRWGSKASHDATRRPGPLDAKRTLTSNGLPFLYSCIDFFISSA